MGDNRTRTPRGNTEITGRTRHRFVWRVLCVVLYPFVTRIFRFSPEPFDRTGPCLIVSNHVTNWDPVLIAMSLRRKQAYFVASEHLFRKGRVTRILTWLFAPISRGKGGASLDTVRACLRHLREGDSVCLFAEGDCTWDGRSAGIFPATGKLVRNSGAALITYRFEGSYLTYPRWGGKLRKGKMTGRVVNVYEPEQLREMTPQEISEAVNRDIYVDAMEQQRQAPVRYRSKAPAEYLETALYLCPECRRIGTLRSSGEYVRCSCGFTRQMTETGFFEPREPFEDVSAWDAWQQECLRELDFTRETADGCLFGDGDMILTRIENGHREERVAAGRLVQYEDGFAIGELRFPLAEVSGMAIIRTNMLVFTHHKVYYELRAGDRRANLRKYLAVWQNAHSR